VTVNAKYPLNIKALHSIHGLLTCTFTLFFVYYHL